MKSEKIHKIKNVYFKDNNLYLNIDEKNYSFALKDNSIALLSATESERNHFEISASGYGIHWPDIDEDLSIDGLLGIVHKPARVSITS